MTFSECLLFNLLLCAFQVRAVSAVDQAKSLLRGSGSGNRSNDNEFKFHRPRHLSQLQFDEVWSSEAEHEFLYDSDGVIWETMMDLTWNETVASERNGFIICSEMLDASGYVRRMDLESKLSSTMEPLYNSKGKSCFITYLNMEMTQSLSGNDYIMVHPMNASLKLRQGVSVLPFYLQLKKIV